MVAVTADLAGLELHPDSLPRLERLLKKNWELPGDHPIARLHDVPLRDYRLLALLGPKNNVGSRYIHLFLADSEGRLADRPLAFGLFNSGPYPAYNWIELTRYDSVLQFDGRTVDLADEGLDRELFLLMSDLVPPGGHIMCEYDSPSQRATERVLTLGYPQAASPLGFLMFQAGCRSYRDWYISEGGREGPRKLQAFKPLNDEIAREKEALLRDQLASFVESPPRDDREWTALARRNAKAVLDAL
jgi:hypothetical protein